MPENIDVVSNRKNIKWTFAQKLYRVLWSIAYVFFRLSPRQAWKYRCYLLRLFGATVGAEVHIHPSVKVFFPRHIHIGDYTAIGSDVNLYALGAIKIGDRVTISQGAHICAGTHDYTTPAFDLIKSPINIGNDVWVAAEAFIGPGAVIDDFAIVGARAVVFGRVEASGIYIGNPAKKIGER